MYEGCIAWCVVRSVCGLQCEWVADCGGCGVRELQCVGVAVCGDCGLRGLHQG